MNRFYLAGALALITVGSAVAQSKFDAATLMLLQNRHETVEDINSTARLLSVKDAAADRTMAFIVKKTADCDKSDLEAAGAQVMSSSATIAVINTTLDNLEKIAALEGVVAIAANHQNTSYCNLLRAESKVDAVHNGSDGLPQAYTGRGVIAGVVDTGIEPVHVNFADEYGSETRVKRMWHFTGNDGRFVEYDSEMVYDFRSDNINETHGTHVAGIMGGSYAGAGKYAYLTDRGATEVKNLAMPFKGMAPNADMLLSGGALYDANIIGGVHNIMEYAEETGQPFVINLSLGHNHGPHDGSDITTAALDEAGLKGIVCVAAGNEGDTPLAVTKTLSADDNKVVTFIKDNTAYGIIDIWVSNDKPVKASWALYDSQRMEFVEYFTADNDKPGETSYLGNKTTYTQIPLFNSNFTGYVTLQPSLDPLNNRWHIYCTADVKQKLSAVWLALVIEGEEGQRVDIYGNEKTLFTNRGLSEFEDGGFDGTINGMACGKNMIVVGSYTTRNVLPNISGTSRNMGGTIGQISSFSSWGSLHDGRKLPHVCAPGEWIASSVNSTYVNNGKLDALLRMGEATGLLGTMNYWGYLQGTSMATPAVAGIIATWLEAAPGLSTDQVRDILNRTSVRDEFVAQNPDAWGAGKIDALAGIKEAINLQTSINSVDADNSKSVMVTPADGSIEVFVAGADEFSVEIYDVQGRMVKVAQSAGNTLNIETSALDKGVYVVAVDTPAGRVSRKVALR